jgi:hypothetical protein
VFQWAEGVPGAGVLLALPSLLNQGLIEVGREVYGSLRNGYYGLRSVLLTFWPLQQKSWVSLGSGSLPRE